MIRRLARLIVATLVLIAAFGFTSFAGRPADRSLTMTPSAPLREATPTPTPARARTAPPTVIVPGRIYEGNLAGDTATFILNAELGQLFMFDVATEDFDAVIEVYDSADNQITRDDDGGPGNMPLLIFSAPATGQFKVVVHGYSDPVEGSYILRVSTAVDVLSFGESVAVEMDGTTPAAFVFEAESGDVINLTAMSGDTIDTTLRLLRPDNTELAYIDDFDGVDPEFRRLPLPDTGRYVVIHAPYSTSAVGEVLLLLEKTELGRLSADPVRVELTGAGLRDNYVLDVEEGDLYLITLSSDDLINGSIDITDIQSSNFGSVNFNMTEGASMFFRATFAGPARVSISISDATGLAAPIDVFLSARAVSE